MTSQPTSHPADDLDATLMDGLDDEPYELDSVDRRVRSLIYDGVYRAYGYTRMPGSVYYEDGEVA